MNFLTFLRDDLRAGVLLAPGPYRTRHAAWLAAKQTACGGFQNRRGEPDLYYTAFALRGLSALDALTPAIATHAGAYLLGLLAQPAAQRILQPHGCFSDAVMAVSWWDSLALCEEQCGPLLDATARTAARDESLARLAALRRDDGGFSKGDRDAVGSLYHTFLGMCACLRMDAPLPEPERAAALLKALALPSGGFLENRFSKKPGTNGCAAAVGLALVLGVELDAAAHTAFLQDMVSPEGGFFATPAAPIADLLSTYTGLFALKMLGVIEPLRIARALGYARTLEQPGGGYTGFALETLSDCEYTFYGLGVEGLAHSAARQLS